MHVCARTLAPPTVLLAVGLVLVGPLTGCAGPDVSAEVAPLAPGALTSPEGLAAYLGAATDEGLRDLRSVPGHDVTVAEFEANTSCRVTSYRSPEEAREEGPGQCAEAYRANGVRGGVSEYGRLWEPRERRVYADEPVGRWLSGCHVVGSAHALCWSDHRDGAEQFDSALRALARYAESSRVATAAP